MRVISEIAVGRSLTSDGTAKAESTMHRHREFVAGAIVDDSSLGGQRNRALLLVSRLLDESSVAEDLQVDQTRADRDAPEKQDRAQKIQTGVLCRNW